MAMGVRDEKTLEGTTTLDEDVISGQRKPN
jgi:hypothetical protein